jgi:hypothetical protein
MIGKLVLGGRLGSLIPREDTVDSYSRSQSWISVVQKLRKEVPKWWKSIRHIYGSANYKLVVLDAGLFHSTRVHKYKMSNAVTAQTRSCCWTKNRMQGIILQGLGKTSFNIQPGRACLEDLIFAPS